MEDEHLSTIPETESDELIKSSVENLVPLPSEFEDFSDIKSECDVPVCDNFTTFSNPLFDANDDFSSSDDESFSDEDISKEIYSNPLFDEEIISTKIDPHHFNVESDRIESLLNRDTLIISSPTFDSLLEEFSGELAHIDKIPLGINEVGFDPEEESIFGAAAGEHLSTIPETKLAELIRSNVENLVPIPSESEDFSDIKSKCDVPVCDNFITFSNPLFDDDDDFSTSDYESFSDEDVPKKIYSNPIFYEEIISTKIDPHHFNAESDLIESLLNRDISIVSSPKIDSLLEEFSGELAHIDLIPPGINETIFDPEEEIRLVEKLLYDNSSPRPPDEFNSKNYDIKSFSPSHILVEDSDSLMEEIDLFLTPDDSMPPGIKNDDYDSEGDNLFLEELLNNDPLSLPENESFHFDSYYVPSSPRPLEKPPNDDDEPDTRVFTKVVDDISDNSTRELYVRVPNVLPTLPTLSPMFDTLIPFSSENEDKVHLLSHPVSRIAPDFEASHARGFVLHSLELQSFA
ncbi:hypothetical protein Tco_0981725 [Tanacetum coccineum]